MLQSEIKIVELQFHKLQRIIIIYFDCDNYTLTDQLHVTVRIYANVCTSFSEVLKSVASASLNVKVPLNFYAYV